MTTEDFFCGAESLGALKATLNLSAADTVMFHVLLGAGRRRSPRLTPFSKEVELAPAAKSAEHGNPVWNHQALAEIDGRWVVELRSRRGAKTTNGALLAD